MLLNNNFRKFLVIKDLLNLAQNLLNLAQSLNNRLKTCKNKINI